MSLIKYGIAAAAGYYFGQPRGRRQLARLGQRIQQLGKAPKVKQLQERGWDKAYDSATAAKRLVSSKLGGQKTVDPVTAAATTAADAAETAALTAPAPSAGAPDQALQAAPRPTPRHSASPTPTDPALTDPAPTGFGGRTVAEDSEAAFSGLVPPPPVGRTTPSSSTDQL